MVKVSAVLRPIPVLLGRFLVVLNDLDGHWSSSKPCHEGVECLPSSRAWQCCDTKLPQGPVLQEVCYLYLHA